jgi:hypothetical protein
VTIPHRAVRPEPVEGLSFLLAFRKKREGFDKLSPNGAGGWSNI